jgi:hypothetical protein
MTTPRPEKPSFASRGIPRPARPWGITIAATLSLAAGATGCGGGGKASTSSATPPISKAEFVAKANGICASADPNLAAENAKLSATRPTPAAIVAAVKGIYAPSIEAQIVGIRALGTPPGDQATVTRMLQLVEADLAKVKADPKLIITNVFGDFAKVAHPYGLTACAPLS